MKVYSYNRGLTLSSLLVAVALSGVVAVFGTRMIVNQMTLANTAEIMDKGESIFRFYKSLLLDTDVWNKTLDANTSLKNYVKGHDTSYSSSNNNTSLVDVAGNQLIPSGGGSLKDDMIGHTTGGWWKLGLYWQKKGRGSVDLVLELCLDKSIFQGATENIGRKNIADSYRYLCPQKRTFRIRYSENSVQASPCQADGKAIVRINRHSINNSRLITCSGQKLVNTSVKQNSSQSGRECLNENFVGSIGAGSASCVTGRTGVNARYCYNGSFVQINSDGTTHCSSDRFLVNRYGASCPHSRSISGNGEVVCGFNSDMTVRCCPSKGPDGVQGLRSGNQGPTGLRGPFTKGPIGPKGHPPRDPPAIPNEKGDTGDPGPTGDSGTCWTS